MTHNQQHTYGSKCSYLNSPFVQKTWNARKKRCVTGSAENAFVMSYLCSIKVVNVTKCLTIECLIGIDNRYGAVGMLRGMSVNDVAVHFNLNRSTIFRLKRKLN